jgi:3,4-dihydroxy 2-butanone 4-phosphate synthase/GTP cyclohydrolase II
MSNNPDKFRAVKRSGLEVVESVSLQYDFHETLARYLRTKRDQMGHLINIPEERYERAESCVV